MSNILNKSLKQCKRPQRKVQLPWVSDGVRQLIKKKNFALKTYLKTRYDTDLMLFKGLRNQVVKELRNLKANYYMKILTKAKGNCKVMWKQINSLIKPNANTNNSYELKCEEKNISDPVQVANAFNQFFIKSVQDLASNFLDDEPNSVNLNILPSANENSFKIREVDQAVVMKAISDLNTNLSKDNYNIDTTFLKKYYQIIIQPFSYIINVSIKTRIFPDTWKKALVKPIFKSGNTTDVSNYRPISLVPVMSKILEIFFQNS